MGDDVIYPHFSRVAPAHPRWVSVPGERARPQSAFCHQDPHDPRHDGAPYLNPDVAPLAPTAPQALSLVTPLPHALSVDTHPTRGIPLSFPGD